MAARPLIRDHSLLPRPAQHGQTLFQIADQVLNMLQAHGQADHLFSHAHFFSQLRSNHGVRGQHRNGHQRIHSTEAGRQSKQIQRLGYVACIGAAAIHFEAQNAARAGQLLLCDGVVRMLLQQRIVHSRHLGMLAQELGDPQRALVLALDADGQRLDSAEQQKRRVRIHTAAEVVRV